jgi:restriction endonuclease Mrr
MVLEILFAGIICLSVPTLIGLFAVLLLLIGELRAREGMNLPRRRTGLPGVIGSAQKAARQRIARKEDQQKRQAHQRYIDAVIATEDVRELTPAQFERYVGMLFEAFGCEVLHTGQTNDGGVDLVVSKNGKRGVVQCKQYAPENKVGSPTVRDLRGTMVREGADLGFLVTTSTFTQQAVEEAAYTPKITLLDAKKLNELSEQMGID